MDRKKFHWYSGNEKCASRTLLHLKLLNRCSDIATIRFYNFFFTEILTLSSLNITHQGKLSFLSKNTYQSFHCSWIKTKLPSHSFLIIFASSSISTVSDISAHRSSSFLNSHHNIYMQLTINAYSCYISVFLKVFFSQLIVGQSVSCTWHLIFQFQKTYSVTLILTDVEHENALLKRSQQF